MQKAAIQVAATRVALAAASLTLAVTANAASPRFGSLPAGDLSTVPSPTERPGRIPAGESVPDIHPALQPNMNPFGAEGMRVVSLFADEAQAAEFRRSGFQAAALSEASDDSACFVVADHWRLDQGSREWPSTAQQRLSLQAIEPGSEAAKRLGGSRTGVVAVHSEQLVPDGADAATLRVTDAWLDPLSLGVRLIGRSNLRLHRVAGAEGVAVYAARSGRGEVHFVVHQPSASKDLERFVGRHMLVSRGSEVASTDCAHARVTLRSAPGAGEQASVRLEVLLPDADGEGGEHRPALSAPRTALGRLFGARGGAEVEPRELRVRSLMVHLSVSQTSGEPEPLASVSFGWRGRERRMQAL